MYKLDDVLHQLYGLHTSLWSPLLVLLQQKQERVCGKNKNVFAASREAWGIGPRDVCLAKPPSWLSCLLVWCL